MGRSHTAELGVGRDLGRRIRCVDFAYLVFERAVMAQADCSQVPDKARWQAKFRSMLTLAIFATAAAAAFASPICGVALICLALSFFVRPEVPGMRLATPAMT
jgi:hypothetical protein